MKAVVLHGVEDIRLDGVPDARIQKPTDAVNCITSSAIYETNPHTVRETFSRIRPGTILRHEVVGVVEDPEPIVPNFEIGERAVAMSTIAFDSCSYCRSGYHLRCDVPNQHGNRAKTAFFVEPGSTGPFDGLQAAKSRMPSVATTSIKLPEGVSHEQGIMMSEIFSTSYYGADLAKISEGDTVADFGCGPVGQFTIASAKMMNASRMIAVDRREENLAMARRQVVGRVNYEKGDRAEPVAVLTGGIGVDRVIRAVGVDFEHAHHGPAAKAAEEQAKVFKAQQDQVAIEPKPDGGNWHLGDAPTQALDGAVAELAKAGTLTVSGIYPPTMKSLPIGMPVVILTETEPLTGAVDAYNAFDRRQRGWIKVELEPA